jgi:hypothetical protein
MVDGNRLDGNGLFADGGIILLDLLRPSADWPRLAA